MYHHITGPIVHLKPTLCVVEAGGVGYELEIPVSTYEALQDEKESARLLTHLHVREDQLKLYGFATDGERVLFRELLRVSGIGPSIGLNILSGSSVAEVVRAIATGDKKLLTTIKGIGKKTAQRLILELKERIEDVPVGGVDVTAPPSAEKDAAAALVSLGFGPAKSQRAVKKAADELGKDARVEDLVKLGLKHAR